MRPSMRVPLREAKFICSNCRPVSGPRVSPLGQFRRYASDSPGVLERTRRKLWGTDSPPGQADPYTGSQIMQEAESSSGESKPADEDFNLAQPEELGAEDLDWNELPQIGYLPKDEWRIKGANKGDKVTPYVSCWVPNSEPCYLDRYSDFVSQQVVPQQEPDFTLPGRPPGRCRDCFVPDCWQGVLSNGREPGPAS